MRDYTKPKEQTLPEQINEASKYKDYTRSSLPTPRGQTTLAPMKQRSNIPVQQDKAIVNMYKDYAQARKGEVAPVAPPSIAAANPYLARSTQIKPTAGLKDVGAALTSGAAQSNIGLANALRTLNAPVSYLGSKLDTLVTGKETTPFKDPLSRGLESVVKQQETAVAPYQERVAQATGPSKYILGALQSLPQIAPAFVGATQPQILGSIGAQAFGSQAREAEKQDKTKLQQVVSALGAAGTEIATEALPIANLTKIIKGQGTLKTLVGEVLAEFGGESLAQALNPFIESAYKNDAVKEAYTTNLKQTAKEILDAGITGATAAILLGGSAMGMNINTSTPEATQQTVEAVKQEMATRGIDVPPVDQNELARFYQQQAQMTEPTPQAEVNPNLERFKTQQAIEQRKAEEAQAGQFTPIENQYFQPEVAKPITPLQAPTPQAQPITPTQDVKKVIKPPKEFENTKVKDEKGEIKTLYHGTGDNFDMFDIKKSGSATGMESAKQGFYFTDNKDVANTYRGGQYETDALWNYVNNLSQKELDTVLKDTELEGEQLEDLSKKDVSNVIANYDRLDDTDNYKEFVSKVEKATNGKLKPDLWSKVKEEQAKGHGTLKKVNVNMVNPLEVDFKGEAFDDEMYVSKINEAKENGYDGVIFKNVEDTVQSLTDKSVGELSTVYFVFKPEQVAEYKEPVQAKPITPTQQETAPIELQASEIAEDSMYDYVYNRPIPEADTNYPQKGYYPAIKTDDGQLFVDKQGRPHVKFIKEMNIPPSRIVSGGQFVDGIYEPGERTDTMRYANRQIAKLKTEYKRLNKRDATIKPIIQPKQAEPIKPTLKPKLEAKVAPKIEPKAKIEPSLKTTLSEDIGIKDEAEVRKMIVRAETLKDDIKAIKQIAPEEVSALAKYEKLIDEVFEKGMSRASKNQISRLIATEQSIKPLKEKYKQQIAEVKEQAKLKQQEKDLKRKQATMDTKLLKVSKEMKAGKLQPEFQKVADEMFGNIDTMAKSISSKKLIELNNTLDNITELEEQGILVDEELRKSVERLNRKQIVDLTIEEKQDLLDLAMHLKHLNTTKNKALTFKKNTDIKQMAKGIANVLLIKPSRKAKKAIKTDTIVENKGRLEFITSFVGRPALTIRNLMYEVGRANENSKAVQLADEILDRANVELKNKRSLTKMLNDKIGNFHKLASSKAWNKVQDSGFKSGEKVYLKLALNDANVLESLKEMGYRRKTSLSPTKITKAEIENIKLNADEQKVYNAASDFFEETYNLLNEAYLLQNNFELKRADKGKYLPKKVSDMTIREELGQVMLPGGLKNTGVIQARKGTLNELILPDIMDIYQRQIDISTKYNAYTNLVQDVSKVFSKPELRIALRTEYGQDQNGKSIVENYMNDLFQDLQGTKQAKRTKLEDALRTIRTKAAPAILSFRATTPMIQTASLPMAFTELSAKNIARGLAGKGGFKEAMQYNERANARAEGRIDRELAESKVNAFTNFGLKAIQAVDKATVGKLWNATKYQVAEEAGLSGEKLLEATSKRFDRVLDTQPNYTTADRSMTMRSQSEVDKALTMFSSAKSSVLNELKRGYIKGKYTGDYSQLAKASAGLTTSIFMMSAISNGLKKLEGDDEKFTEALMKRTLGALPLLDIVTSVMQGYDISNVGIDTIEDLGRAFTSTIDLIIDTATDKQIDERKLVKTFWDTVDASALMLGVPVETLRNDIKLAVNASRNDELKVLFKRYTDPLNKTELYKQIASPTSEKALQGLLKQLKNVDTDEKKLITNLRSKLKEGETTPKRIELVLKQIKTKQ